MQLIKIEDSLKSQDIIFDYTVLHLMKSLRILLKFYSQIQQKMIRLTEKYSFNNIHAVPDEKY